MYKCILDHIKSILRYARLYNNNISHKVETSQKLHFIVFYIIFFILLYNL